MCTCSQPAPLDIDAKEFKPCSHKLHMDSFVNFVHDVKTLKQPSLGNEVMNELWHVSEADHPSVLNINRLSNVEKHGVKCTPVSEVTLGLCTLGTQLDDELRVPGQPGLRSQ